MVVVDQRARLEDIALYDLTVEVGESQQQGPRDQHAPDALPEHCVADLHVVVFGYFLLC